MGFQFLPPSDVALVLLTPVVMPRRPRADVGGYVLHVMNRGCRRGELFTSHAQYEAFETLLREALEVWPVDLYDYCLMPTHFHFVIRPPVEGDLRHFMQQLTGDHARAWRRALGTVGEGAVYQGRYKPIPVQTEEYFLTLCRYVARNPVRAGLVARAEDWPWCATARIATGRFDLRLSRWPIPRPENWLVLVNEPLEESVVAVIRKSVNRGCPLGNPSWQERVAKSLGIERTLRGPGRPKATRVADRKN